MKGKKKKKSKIMIRFENTNGIKKEEGLGFTLLLVEFYHEGIVIEVCNLKLTIDYPLEQPGLSLNRIWGATAAVALHPIKVGPRLRYNAVNCPRLVDCQHQFLGLLRQAGQIPGEAPPSPQ